MSELRERVARALCDDAYKHIPPDDRQTDFFEPDREYWIGQADAAIALIRADTLEEAAKVVPTTWLDPLLTGPGATELPLDGPGVEKLCRGITAAIRAMKDQTTT